MERAAHWGFCVATAVLMGSVGCSSSSTAMQSPTVEIFSWWSSPSETAALRAVLDVHEEAHPTFLVKNAAEENATDARVRLADRMRRGLPPDTFQANVGRDLSQWVLFEGLTDEDGKVASLNDLAEANSWVDKFPTAVMDALSFEDTMYGVPLNVHRLNTLLYNKRTLDSLELDPPRTLPELRDLLATLVDLGYRQPISIGNVNNWTMSLFTMENLFPAIAGADFYREYWAGRHAPEHALMRQTLDELLALWPYFNEDAMDIDWTAGVDLLFAEDPSVQAVMTVMGDWAKGHLLAEGYEPGGDFGLVPFPGSQGTFVFTSDCFPLPKGAPHRHEVTELLMTFGSREGQIAFNAAKGSLPARTDIDPEDDLDELAQGTWQDFQDDEKVLALSGVLDGDFAGALAEAVRETLLDQDPDPVLFALRNNL